MSYEDAVTEYILDVGNHPLTLNRFINDNLTLIVSNLAPGDDIPTTCSNLFHRIAKKHQIPVDYSVVDWPKIAFEFVKHLAAKDKGTRGKQARAASRSGSSTGSSSFEAPSTQSPDTESSTEGSTALTNCKLTQDDKASIEKMYTSLDESKMWELSTGTIVEKQMEKLASDSVYEHPCHSLILDPYDSSWTPKYFTKGEIKEIIEFNPPRMAPLPAALQNYLDEYTDATTLDEVRQINKGHDFHPVQDPVLDWASASIDQALRLTYHMYLSKQRTETDLLKHVWSIISTCYFFGEVDAVSGETSSRATSNRVNSERALATVNKSTRKRIGSKTDILFTTEVLELGTTEAGKVTDTGNTKTLFEAGFKTPKILKDMLLKLLQEAPERVRDIKTCGYTLSGISLMAHVMDVPAGFVCRMNKMQKWLHFPTSADNFVMRMKSLLTVIYNIKGVMERTLKDIETDTIPSFELREPEVEIPPCFTQLSKPSRKHISRSTDGARSAKKQKTSETNSI